MEEEKVVNQDGITNILLTLLLLFMREKNGICFHSAEYVYLMDSYEDSWGECKIVVASYL